MFTPGLGIVLSEYAGELRQVRFPKPTVRKYKTRTARRFSQDPRNYRNVGVGRFYIIGGTQVVMHPDDFPKFKRAVGGM